MRTFWDENANPIGVTAAKLIYDLQREDAADGLILDAVTIREILEDSDGDLAMDALVMPYQLMERKMKIFQRVMENTHANVKPVSMQISSPFRKNGVVNVAAVFELSDGQTISIFFHNPDTTPTKLAPKDELISWKWLLNKKDVTILVAPERGEDLNVREVCRRVLKLADKNGPAFARRNAKKAETLAQIDTLTKEVETLTTESDAKQKALKSAKAETEALEQTLAQAKDKAKIKEETPEPQAADMGSDHARALAGINALPLAEIVRSKFITKSGKTRGGEFEIEFLENNQVVDIRNDLASLRIYGRSSRSQLEDSYTRGYAASRMRGGSLIYTDTLTVEQVQKFYDAIGVVWTPDATDENDTTTGDTGAVEILKLLGITEPGFEKPEFGKKSGVYLHIYGKGDKGLDINAYSNMENAPAGQRGFMLYRWQGNDQLIIDSRAVSVEDMARIFELAGQEWRPQIKARGEEFSKTLYDDPWQPKDGARVEAKMRAVNAAGIVAVGDFMFNVPVIVDVELFKGAEKLATIERHVEVSVTRTHEPYRGLRDATVKDFGFGKDEGTEKWEEVLRKFMQEQKMQQLDFDKIAKKAILDKEEEIVEAVHKKEAELAITPSGDASFLEDAMKVSDEVWVKNENYRDIAKAVCARHDEDSDPLFQMARDVRQKIEAAEAGKDPEKDAAKSWLNDLRDGKLNAPTSEITAKVMELVDKYQTDAEMFALVETAFNAFQARIVAKATAAKGGN